MFQVTLTSVWETLNQVFEELQPPAPPLSLSLSIQIRFVCVWHRCLHLQVKSVEQEHDADDEGAALTSQME